MHENDVILSSWLQSILLLLLYRNTEHGNINLIRHLLVHHGDQLAVKPSTIITPNALPFKSELPGIKLTPDHLNSSRTALSYLHFPLSSEVNSRLGVRTFFFNIKNLLQ